VTAPLTMKDIRDWPPTVDVGSAAQALGVSRSSLYEAIRTGRCPVRTLTVGHRRKVLTASLVAVLEDDGAARPART
jgi:Helix-turn-helix domain